MFPLQSLPKLEQPPKHKRSKSSISSGTNNTQPSTPSEDPALAVLREQRDQIAHFLSRAQKERKLNDAGVLRKNLEELEAEIARHTRPAKSGS